MLVLSRKKNESVVVGDNVQITVLEITGNRVRLGINAPHEVPVMREELLAQMNRERELVVEMSLEDLEAVGVESQNPVSNGTPCTDLAHAGSAQPCRTVPR